MKATRALHIRLQLAPNVCLYDTLVNQLQGNGISNASITILGGQFSELYFCVAPPDPTKNAVIRYSNAISAGKSEFIFGNATVGKDFDDNPIVHCHAAFVDQNGNPLGGHILASKSRVGAHPISALVTSIADFDLRLCLDEETNVCLMKPAKFTKPYASKASLHEHVYG
jgi:predicted DNA-binding protein with PD1-like motif